jgi:hypothetical protein
MHSAFGPIKPPNWRHSPAFSNASQVIDNNLAIPADQILTCNKTADLRINRIILK